MRVKLYSDIGIIIEPETDFEAEYLEKNYRHQQNSAFLKRSGDNSFLVGLVIQDDRTILKIKKRGINQYYGKEG